MDGGAASIHSDPSPSLMDDIRSMLSFTDDRNTQISILKSVLKRNQEHAIPLDLPRDLILEAKVRLGNEKKAAVSNRVAPNTSDADSRRPDAESCKQQLLHAKRAGGSILSNAEVAALETHGSGENKSGSAILQLNNSVAPPPRAATWSSLFSHQVGRTRDLKHHHQPSQDPDHHIEFDDEDSSAAVQNWGNSLVGYFIGNTPSTPVIKMYLEKAWRIRDLEIIPMAEGFFLFKFAAYDIGQRILDEGPWFVYGHPLILKRWTADITMSRQHLESILVWVRLPNLNFCFRSNSALSKIATVIGNPICMDHATAAGTRYAFARICVEVDVDAEFPSELRMKYKEKTIIQKVEYAWKPNPCKTCRTFNHGDNSCPLKTDTSKPNQIWVPKKKQAKDPTTDINQGTEHNQNNSHGEARHTEGIAEDWNTVKRSKISDRATSPAKDSSTSPKISLTQPVSNRFLSLSNLDGDSNASAEDISSTAALVLKETDTSLNHPSSGMQVVIQGTEAISSQVNYDDQQKSLFSIHQLDKSLLSRVPSSSSSARHKPRPAGITIKEKPPKNRST